MNKNIFRYTFQTTNPTHTHTHIEHRDKYTFRARVRNYIYIYPDLHVRIYNWTMQYVQYVQYAGKGDSETYAWEPKSRTNLVIV